MGGVLSRWRKKKSTDQQLDDLHTKIEALEESKKTNVEQQKRLIGSLILYSVLLYIGAALVFYFYYMPELLIDKVIYSSPLAAFPVLVLLTRRFLHWYFVKRITKNEAALQELKDKRKTILEEVMEKETYKKAKEILEKYDPERFKTLETPAASSTPKTADGQELRQRRVPPGPGQTPAARMPSSTAVPSPISTPQYTPRPPGGVIPPSAHRNGSNIFPGQMRAPVPGPPLPRPVLPRERSMVDRMMEYLVGDGPQNRYALVCRDCHSHNGMALREEFEFISFRCCYCFTLNPARKQRPHAPRLETMTPARLETMTPVRPVARQPQTEEEEESEADTEEKQAEGPAGVSSEVKGQAGGSSRVRGEDDDSEEKKDK